MADHAKNPTLVDNLGDNTVLNALKQLLSFAQSLNVATGTFEIGSLPALDGEEVSQRSVLSLKLNKLSMMGQANFDICLKALCRLMASQKRISKFGVATVLRWRSSTNGNSFTRS